MSVHYKFKSANKKWQTVSFDSSTISTTDLKRAIAAQERTDPNSKFDLILVNAQTGEKYTNENYLIPKNTSVEVRRVPLAAAVAVIRIRQPQEAQTGGDQSAGKFANDLSLPPIYQEDSLFAFGAPVKLAAVVEATPGYTCNRCGLTGHSVGDCPGVSSPPQQQRQLVPVDQPIATLPVVGKTAGDKVTCSLCRTLFRSPSTTPCCFYTYCRGCLLQELVSARKCPGCGDTGLAPDDIHPNRGMEKRVAEYTSALSTSARSDSPPISPPIASPQRIPSPPMAHRPSSPLTATLPLITPRPSPPPPIVALERRPESRSRAPVADRKRDQDRSIRDTRKHPYQQSREAPRSKRRDDEHRPQDRQQERRMSRSPARRHGDRDARRY